MRMSSRILAIVIVTGIIVAYLPGSSGAAAEQDNGSKAAYSPSKSEAEYARVIGKDAVIKPSKGGALRLVAKNGIKTLSDASGKPIQLRGMSTHGLQWFPQIVNDNAFAALAEDWESNVIRLAMYVGENGYASTPAVIKQRVIDGIEFAIKNDMYVIVDWHVHAPGDPNAEVYAGAMDFFSEISDLYPNNKHILYELANEPSSNEPGVTNDAAGWATVKSYAEPIVKMLRGKGNDNIIIVGSPNWSQRPDLAADNPIMDLNKGVADANTMYTVHFYTGTHAAADKSSDRTNVMSNARYALEHGEALFATEWGTSEASGNNGPFLQEADVWLDFLNENNISWVNWSLTNKNETSGAFTPFELGKTEATNLDPGIDRKWDVSELSISGEYVRARIKGIAYEPKERVVAEQTIVNAPLGVPTLPSNFEDSTLQGWGWDGASGVKGALTIEEANGSKAVAWEVAYPEVKPTDGWASAPRIMLAGINATRGTNRYLIFDLFLKPVRASEGKLSINLAMAPPSLGYWAQASDNYDISLAKLGERPKTADGLYRIEVSFDMNKINENKSIEAETVLRDLTIVVADVDSDYAGTMYLDNVRFANQPSQSGGEKGDGGGEGEAVAVEQATRAEFVAALVKALGLTASAEGKSAFVDVDPANENAGAIAAAHEAGIVKGRSGERFGPNEAITREEMAVMIARAYEHKSGKEPPAGEPNFADNALISSWAKAAVGAVQALGIMKGSGDKRFDPKGTVTPAASEVIIRQLMRKA
ncbi:carbohydrate-binding domain-containing protein [Cohnella herbarum]|nr:cellulase family glycosylhydrolase [Cohnella herbarum]